MTPLFPNQLRHLKSSYTSPASDSIIVESLNSPYVKYSAHYKTLSISGASFLPNARVFYQPLFEQIYAELLTGGRITLEFNYSAFCLKTLKLLFEFYGNLRHFKKLGNDIHVIWHTNNQEDLQELGLAFGALFDMDVRLVHAASEQKEEYGNEM